AVVGCDGPAGGPLESGRPLLWQSGGGQQTGPGPQTPRAPRQSASREAATEPAIPSNTPPCTTWSTPETRIVSTCARADTMPSRDTASSVSRTRTGIGSRVRGGPGAPSANPPTFPPDVRRTQHP